jgi:hypothetical protein
LSQQAAFELKGRNPDVLTSIANLSNDEVFTPPELANQMLDDLANAWAKSNGGAEIWKNSEVTFLDPFTKSGVFLRELTKRLVDGLKDEIPNLQDRVNHVLTKQVFGIGITQLTSLLARRSLYCSKFANGAHSICTAFDDDQGNIWFERTEHTWVGGTDQLLTHDDNGNEVLVPSNGRCRYCGANQSEYSRDESLETHAYTFIHTDDIKKRLEEIFGEDMKFDVIVGNPPYQLSVGNTGATSATARAIYHEFLTQAIALEPRFVSMIIPSRWMTRSTKGVPDTWIDKVLSDKRFRVLVDYLDSTLVFPGVDIKGGICHFLWDRDNEGTCEYVIHKNGNQADVVRSVDYLDAKNVGVIVRDIEAISIIDKIEKVEGDWLSEPRKNFSGFVSPKDFFTNKVLLTSSWNGFSREPDDRHSIKCYVNKSMHGVAYGFVGLEDIPKNAEVEKFHKVFIPASGWGAAMDSDDPVLGKPFVGEPHSVCSQTYLVIGYDQSNWQLSNEECQNIVSYVETKFFRYLVSLKKHTQHAARGVYQFVPMQDFSKPWSDRRLYEKYGLTPGEIEAIERKIRPLERESD